MEGPHWQAPHGRGVHRVPPTYSSRPSDAVRFGGSDVFINLCNAERLQSLGFLVSSQVVLWPVGLRCFGRCTEN